MFFALCILSSVLEAKKNSRERKDNEFELRVCAYNN